MSDNASLILADEKEKLVSLGHSIKTLLPGGQNLTENQAISVGNYAALTKANPFRGEIYGYPDSKGNLILVDGYKLLVRWAKSISDYDEDYGERLPSGAEGIEDGDIGYRVTILRHDRKGMMREYIEMGASFKEAYRLVSVSAVGIVKASETYNSYQKKPISPPKGWSWDEVARKRALKNVLNRAYPMPSIEDLARLNWEVNGTQTTPQDWPKEGAYQSSAEVERHAELAARERQRQEKWDGMDEAEREANRQTVIEATAIMRNNGDDDPLDLPETDTESGAVSIPEPLMAFREAVHNKAAEFRQHDKATERQMGLLLSKLEESFAGDEDAPEKGQAVLRWVFSLDSVDMLKRGQARALLGKMLASQDPETGDYPLQQGWSQTAQAIYRQALVENGQMELL